MVSRGVQGAVVQESTALARTLPLTRVALSGDPPHCATYLGQRVKAGQRPSAWGVAVSKVLDEYVRQEGALKGYLRRRSRGGRDVDDLAHEVFIRAFNVEASQPVSEPRALLFKIAHNLTISELRAAGNTPMLSLDEPAAEVGDGRPSAEDEIEGRAKFTAFMRAVAALPKQTGRVFLMRRVNGLSQRETAARLGISESAVEKHVALGLARCTAYLLERGYCVTGRSDAGQRITRTRAG